MKIKVYQTSGNVLFRKEKTDGIKMKMMKSKLYTEKGK